MVASPGRSAALGKYLVAVANSFTEDGWQEGGEGTGRDTADTRKSNAKPTTRRKRLHVLYVLHDVLYHTKYRGDPREDGFAATVRDSLVPILTSVAAFDAPRHVKKIQELLDIWDEKSLFSPTLISSLRAAVEAASMGGANYLGTSAAQTIGSSSTVKAKEVPFMLPAMHGDPSTPWFDLPAANWLPHMQPNSTKPMNPNLIKPLRLAPGLADKGLVDAVKQLLSNVERLFVKSANADSEEPYTDLNEMGERVVIDKLTSEITSGQTYYGWSRDFCTKMSRRQKGGNANNDRRGRSDSRESSSPAHKRRRLSRSQSRDRDYSSSRSRSPSQSSRHDSRCMSRRRDQTRSHSGSGSRSQNRNYSRDRYRRRSSSPRRASQSRSRSPPLRSRSRSKSRDRGYRRRYSPSPPQQDRNDTVYMQQPRQPTFQQYMPHLQSHPQSHPHLPPQPFYPNQGLPAPPMPVPPPNFMAFTHDQAIPPPPPNYSGPWPPPPPPIPPPVGNPHIQGMGMPWGTPPGLPGGHPPPPPPPPQSQQSAGGWSRAPNNQYGRGGNSFRGGYGGRGRGRGW